MKIFKTFLALCMSSLMEEGAARASTITLNISGADTGTITLTETGDSSLITAVSGTFDGATIGGLISPFRDGNDNLFFTPAPYFDFNGVSFTLDTPDTFGSQRVNFSFNPITSQYQSLQPVDGIGIRFGPDSVTAVPEPISTPLTLVGLVCFLKWRGVKR